MRGRYIPEKWPKWADETQAHEHLINVFYFEGEEPLAGGFPERVGSMLGRPGHRRAARDVCTCVSRAAARCQHNAVGHPADAAGNDERRSS